MVGLSVILENQKSVTSKNRTPQVISKTSMSVSLPNGRRSSSGGSRPPPPFHLLPPPFPDHCCFCQQDLLPGKDIYMYQGDRAFCSVDCRCRQIFMDDQEETSKKMASAAASSSTASACRRKAGRNRAGGFAY